MIASKRTSSWNVSQQDCHEKATKKKRSKQQTRVRSATEPNGCQSRQPRSLLRHNRLTFRARPDLVSSASSPSLIILSRPSEVKPLLESNIEGDEFGNHPEEPEDDNRDDHYRHLAFGESGIQSPGHRVLSEKDLRKRWLSKGGYSAVPTCKGQRRFSSPTVGFVSRETNVEVGHSNFRGGEQPGSGRTLSTAGRQHTESRDCGFVATTPLSASSELVGTQNSLNIYVSNGAETKHNNKNHHEKDMGNKSIDHAAPTTVKRSSSVGKKSPLRRGSSKHVSLRQRLETNETRDDPSVGEESLCSGATMTTAETGASSLQYSPMTQYSPKKAVSLTHTSTDYRLIATFAPDSSASSTASSDDVLSDPKAAPKKTTSHNSGNKALSKQVSTSDTSGHRGHKVSTIPSQKQKNSANGQRQGWRLLRNKSKTTEGDSPERTSRSKLSSEQKVQVSSPPRIAKKSSIPASPQTPKSVDTSVTPESTSRSEHADDTAASLRTGGQHTRKRLASTCRRDYLSGHVALRRGRHSDALDKLHKSLRAYLPIRGADDLEVAAVHELLGATHVRMIKNVSEEGAEVYAIALGSDAYHMEKALLHYRAVLRILDALEKNEQERRESYVRRRREYLDRKRRKAGNGAAEEIAGDGEAENSLADENDIEDVVQMMTQARRGGFSDCLDKEGDLDVLDSVEEGSNRIDTEKPLVEEDGQGRGTSSAGGKDEESARTSRAEQNPPALPRVVPRHLNLVHCQELTMPPAPPVITPPSSARNVKEDRNGTESPLVENDETQRHQFRRHQLRYRHYFQTVTNKTEMRRRASWSLDALEGKSSSLIEF